jgi:hypothetical protein
VFNGRSRSYSRHGGCYFEFDLPYTLAGDSLPAGRPRAQDKTRLFDVKKKRVAKDVDWEPSKPSLKLRSNNTREALKFLKVASSMCTRADPRILRSHCVQFVMFWYPRNYVIKLELAVRQSLLDKLAQLGGREYGIPYCRASMNAKLPCKPLSSCTAHSNGTSTKAFCLLHASPVTLPMPQYSINSD